MTIIAHQSTLKTSPGRTLFLDMRQASPFNAFLADEQNDERRKEEIKKAIRCRPCANPVTEPSFKSRKNGQFSHVFVNPAGISFRIGIFSRAPGCTSFGPAMEEHTWFEGYGWQIALCTSCQSHLGWRFSSNGGDLFWGLILNNLLIP